MPKNVVNTEIQPRNNGKLLALAKWTDGDKEGTDEKSFDDFNAATEWLNERKTNNGDNIQARAIHTAASHNLDIVIDQLDSVRHKALKPVIDKLKTIKIDLSQVEL